MNSEPIVTLENLAVGHGRQAVLRGLTAEIARGDSVGMLGANGSGKTTLLKTIAGVLPPIAGQLRFPGGVRPVIGYVPQRETIEGTILLSSLEVVLLGTCGRRGPGRMIRRAEREGAFEALAKTGVSELARQPFAELSGGQKQRVLIARALVGQPDLLLLDEPTAGVDPAATRAISELLRELHAQGMTLLMVNHDLPVVRRVSRSIFWVRQGKLEQGTPGEMLDAQRLDESWVE